MVTTDISGLWGKGNKEVTWEISTQMIHPISRILMLLLFMVLLVLVMVLVMVFLDLYLSSFT